MRAAAVLMGVGDEEDMERLIMAHSSRPRDVLASARARIEAGAGIRGEESWKGVVEPEKSKKPD